MHTRRQCRALNKQYRFVKEDNKFGDVVNLTLGQIRKRYKKNVYVEIRLATKMPVL